MYAISVCYVRMYKIGKYDVYDIRCKKHLHYKWTRLFVCSKKLPYVLFINLHIVHFVFVEHGKYNDTDAGKG